MRVPDNTVAATPQAGRAQLNVSDLEIEDYHNLLNALEDGPSDEATVSFDVRWSGPTGRTSYRNVDQQFTGLFVSTSATVEWSAQKEGFEFESDPAETSTTVIAEVGQERNGVFFS